MLVEAGHHDLVRTLCISYRCSINDTHYSSLSIRFSGTVLDANARNAIKKALVLLRGKESQLVPAGKAREFSRYRQSSDVYLLEGTKCVIQRIRQVIAQGRQIILRPLVLCRLPTRTHAVRAALRTRLFSARYRNIVSFSGAYCARSSCIPECFEYTRKHQ